MCLGIVVIFPSLAVFQFQTLLAHLAALSGLFIVNLFPFPPSHLGYGPEGCLDIKVIKLRVFPTPIKCDAKTG